MNLVSVADWECRDKIYNLISFRLILKIILSPAEYNQLRRNWNLRFFFGFRLKQAFNGQIEWKGNYSMLIIPSEKIQLTIL